MKDIVAEGVWCRDCEYFEVPDPGSDGRCMACGCPEEAHVNVEVVTTEDQG